MNFEESRLALEQAQADEKRQLWRKSGFVGFYLLAVVAIDFASSYLLSPALSAAKEQMQAGAWERVWYYLLYIGCYLLMLLVPAVVLGLIFRQRPLPPKAERRRLVAGETWLVVLFGLAFCMLANFLVSFWLYFASQFGIEPYDGQYNADPGLLPLALNLLTYALLPGVVEELVFRGWILGALRPFGEGRALLLSALIFGLAHGNLTQLPFALLLGLMLGYLFLTTGRLWPVMIVHALNNSLSVVLEYVRTAIGLTENEWLVLQIAAMVLISVAGAAAGLLLRHRREEPLFRPLTDRRSVLPEGQRARWMWLSPVIAAGLLVMLFLTLKYEVKL